MAAASERTVKGEVRTKISHPHPYGAVSESSLSHHRHQGGGGCTDASLRLLSAFVTSAGEASRDCGYLEKHLLRVCLLG